MIAMVEIIGAVSIFTALGFLVIFIKETVFEKNNEQGLGFHQTNNSESFINMDMDNLTVDGSTNDNPEKIREKKRRLESFKLRNKFYHS
ncbi:hypothetical protein DZC72_08905 [Maribacter algicola]|uniref:Uncharacterized protein n=2 Tax=Maribacter algicola TaxID=2498892 RepID=A0A426RNS6_9FLAO|nr:hypothetical protein DZC72_08905 [Maribacter algicola]